MSRKAYIIPYKMLECLQKDKWDSMDHYAQINAVEQLFYKAMGEVHNNWYFNTTRGTITTRRGSGSFGTGISESGNFYTVDEDYC